MGLVAAIVVILASSRSGGGPGPLVAGISGEDGIDEWAAVGQGVSASDLIVQNTGDKPVVLDRVELVGLPDSFYRGEYVVPFPLPTIPFLIKVGYRVPSYGRVLSGTSIAPHAKAWIVVGLTAHRGQHAWRHVDLIYHDGSTSYRRQVALSGAVCAPVKTYYGKCHDPGVS